LSAFLFTPFAVKALSRLHTVYDYFPGFMTLNFQTTWASFNSMEFEVDLYALGLSYLNG